MTFYSVACTYWREKNKDAISNLVPPDDHCGGWLFSLARCKKGDKRPGWLGHKPNGEVADGGELLSHLEERDS